MSNAIEVNGLKAGYGIVRVIDDMSFAIPQGTRVALLGRNGMGKTTLLSTLMGFTKFMGGSIKFADEEISGKSATKRAAMGLGLVPQMRDIFASLTVEENLVTGLKGRPASAIQQAYKMFPRLAERKKNLGTQLSGGEQQMLSMARTLLGEPSLLLLDEPLEGLAPVICDELMNSLHSLSADRSITTILVEQQIDRALNFAEMAIVIEHGSIVWSGTAAAIREDASLIDRYLGVGVH